MKDIRTGELQWLTRDRWGSDGANGSSTSPQMSSDGRFVVFTSKASNLVENDNNNAADIFVHDRLLGLTILVSANRSGTGSGSGPSSNPLLASDGRTIAFQSFADDLAGGDYNNTRDIFSVRMGSTDSDGDGMDDEWEVAYFGDLSRDGTGDFDGDGQSDLTEFLAGTDPTNSGSILRVISLTSPGETSLAFAAEVNAELQSIAKGPVVFTSQPTDQYVNEGEPVTFHSVSAGASECQWYRNGLPIPGGTNADLIIPRVPLTFNNSVLFVVATNSESYAISSNARLAVLPDIKPPQLISALALDTNRIRVTFSESVDAESATNINHYFLTNAAGQNPIVLGATLLDSSNVVLNVTQPLFDKTVLLANGVRDGSVGKNAIIPGSAVTLGLSLSIPIDATWSYDQSGQDFGTVWRSSSYDDSAWPTGQGLFYVTTAPLPAPKNTLLLTEGGRALTNYYFRKLVSCPIGSTNVAVTFRHVVDDGSVFYINGMEFHRFNMPSGNISFGSLASFSIGNAVYSQSYTQFFNNLVVGPNVLSAELHQATTASADLCFGAEFGLSVPSLVLPTPLQPPAVHIAAQPSGSTYLFWNGSGQVLEESPTIAPQPQWKAVRNQANPFLAQATNEMRFYRLRR